LAVAVAEMAFGGGIGAEIDLRQMSQNMFIDAWTALFAESNSRFICEVKPEHAAQFEELMVHDACNYIGTTTVSPQLIVRSQDQTLVDMPLELLKKTWLKTLDWA